MKIVYSDTGREKYIQYRTKKEVSPEGYDKLSNQQYLIEEDCKNHRYKILFVVNYDKDGNVIHSEKNNKREEWEYIVPDTNGETLKKKVCE